MIHSIQNERNVATLLKALVVFLFSYFTFSQAASAHEGQHPSVEVAYVDAAKARELIANDPNIIVLDVRTKGEYNRGHIEDAIQINYFSLKFKKRLRELNRNKHYVVHCKSGHRSQGAIKRMIKEGFTQITHLDGGYDAWKKRPALSSKLDAN